MEVNLNRSKFDLTSELKTSFDMGKLVPVHWLDVMPGDSIRYNPGIFIRLQPLIAPVMHKMDLYLRSYYVPYRLLQDNFEEMLMKPDSPVTAPSLYDFRSYIDFDSAYKRDNLIRAFGLSPSDKKEMSIETQKAISAYPFLAYYLIYNYYYRDPLLDDSYKDSFKPQDFYDDHIDIIKLQRVNWFSDYFIDTKNQTQYGTEVDLDLDNNSTIKVNEMRTAEKLQRFKEKLLLSGTDYVSYIQSFYGVRPSNYLAQRPVLLGSDKFQLNVTDVDQLVGTTENPLGNVGGKSASLGNLYGYQHDVEEHGIIMTLMFVKPRQSYIAGIPRSFLKKDFYDFAIPIFANLGMQEVSNLEIDSEHPEKDGAFGYQERYAEYKYPVDVVAGNMRDNLDFWHFGRDIRREKLSSDFLTCRPKTSPFALEVTEALDRSNMYLLRYYRVLDGDTQGSAVSYDNYGYALGTKDDLIRFKEKYYPDANTQPEKFDSKYLFYKYNITSERTLLAQGDSLAGITSANIVYNSDQDLDSVKTGVHNANFKKYLEEFKVIVYPDIVSGSPALTQTLDLKDVFEMSYTVNNHCVAVILNEVDALRPLPKIYNPSLL